LTGLWHGFFNYPRALDPGFFEATLVETGEWLGGSISELGTVGPEAGATLFAVVSGRRRGFDVTFLMVRAGGQRAAAARRRFARI
jgi:hypothetical protein